MTDSVPADPQALAEACARAMFDSDRASRALGMTIDSIRPGHAVLSMPVTESMTNGHDICHGGYMFTLADSAFAFACNTYNQRAVAQQCQVSFLKPVSLGETLTAVASERWREGRSGIYDVTVRNGAGDVVAEFRGHSRTIPGANLS